MKNLYKIVYAICFFCAASSIYALPLNYSPSKNLKSTISDGWLEDVFIEFTNTSNKAITINWKGYEDFVPAKWEIGMCNNGECKPNVLTPGAISQIKPGQSGFLKLHVMANNTTGTVKIKFIISDSANVTDSDTLTYEITYTHLVGITDVTETAPAIFQNNNGIAIQANNNLYENATLKILSVTGQEVAVMPFESNRNINTAHLQQGIYIVVLYKHNRQLWRGRFYR